MKRIFEVIGLLSLVCFSFFMTEKTVTVVKNMDDIMIEIKSNYKKYQTDSKDAIIKDNTIIPGISGRKVNINKSYKAMKENGLYSEDLYVYDLIKPKISKVDNKDKVIISGNKTKRLVSLIFILNDDSDIKNLLNILDRNEIKATFFVTENWVTKNNYTLIDLIDQKNTIGNLGDNQNYKDSAFNWMDTIIKKVGKQKEGYCLYKNDNNIKYCQLLDNYTINPIIIDDSYLLNVKKNLTNGGMIALKHSKNMEKELETIIKYIKSRGYDIVNLETNLSE